MHKIWPMDVGYRDPLTWSQFSVKEQELETKLRRFTSLLSFYLCTCEGTMQFKESFYRFITDRKYTHNKLIHSPHHSGELNEIIASGKLISRDDVRKWVLDKEHGLLHGFVVAFLAFQQKYPQGIPDAAFEGAAHLHCEDVQLMASCLFHDFYRVLHEEQNHDREVGQYFSKLLPETYEHSNPIQDSPLVVGDRLELMRFADYKNWIDLDVIRKHVSNFGLLSHFFRYTRPALEKLFLNRYDVWVLHGVEKVKDRYGSGEIYPDHFTYMSGLNGANKYPIEIGDLPFRTCMTHSGRSFQPYGVLPLSEFKAKGGKICFSESANGWENHIYQAKDLFKDGKKRCWTKSGKLVGRRDHLYAVSEIPLGDWLFLLYTRPPKTAKPLLHCAGVIDFVLSNQIIETTTKLINHILVIKT